MWYSAFHESLTVATRSTQTRNGKHEKSKQSKRRREKGKKAQIVSINTRGKRKEHPICSVQEAGATHPAVETRLEIRIGKRKERPARICILLFSILFVPLIAVLSFSFLFLPFPFPLPSLSISPLFFCHRAFFSCDTDENSHKLSLSAASRRVLSQLLLPPENDKSKQTHFSSLFPNNNHQFAQPQNTYAPALLHVLAISHNLK